MWYRAWESNPLLRDYETLTMPYRSARCVRVVELFSPSKQIPDRPKPQNTFWLRFDHTNRHGNLADRTIRRVTDARHRAAIGGRASVTACLASFKDTTKFYGMVVAISSNKYSPKENTGVYHDDHFL